MKLNIKVETQTEEKKSQTHKSRRVLVLIQENPKTECPEEGDLYKKRKKNSSGVIPEVVWLVGSYFMCFKVSPHS